MERKSIKMGGKMYFANDKWYHVSNKHGVPDNTQFMCGQKILFLNVFRNYQLHLTLRVLKNDVIHRRTGFLS